MKNGEVMALEERLFSMEAEFFKALAHPTRVRILKHLKEGPKCVCEFTEDLDAAPCNFTETGDCQHPKRGAQGNL